MKNNIELKSERLLLRPIRTEDAEDVFKYRCDAETNKYQGWIPKDIENVKNFIGKVASKINIPDTWYQFVIIDIESTKIIGDLGIHFLDDKQVEIGCTLEKGKHGKGLATEALKTVINYLFKTLDKHRIIASIDPKNVKSIGLVERLTFRKEAHFIESLLINGEWLDDIVYALLKREWE